MADAYAGKLGGDQASRSMYVDMFRAEGSEDGMLANEAAGLRLILQGGGLDEAESQAYLEALGTTEALRSALNWYRAMSLADVDGLGPITVPTLYIWGTNDVALGPEAGPGHGRPCRGALHRHRVGRCGSLGSRARGRSDDAGAARALRPRYSVIVTGVPAGIVSASRLTTSSGIRMQPFDAAEPMRPGWLVPWKAIAGSPPSNSSSASE